MTDDPSHDAGPDPLVEETMEDLYDHAPCGYLSTTPDGTIVRVNQTLLDWTGYAREELVGARFQTLLTIGSRIYYETHYGPLLRMQGAGVVSRPVVEVELQEAMTNRSGRANHLPVRIRARDGRLVAARVPTAGSADVVAHAAANGLVILDAARVQAAAGEKAPALLLGNFLDRDGNA